MKGANALVIGLVLTMLVAAFVPLAVGEDDSLHVVMTVEDRVYSAGNNIVVELRIYDKGVLVDANGANDTVTVSMIRNHYWNNEIDIPLTNDGTGIYRGTYTIGSYDTEVDDHELRFYYHVIRGDPPHQDEEGTSNPTYGNYAIHIVVYEQDFTVDVTFDGQPGIVGHPGETVRATVRTRLGSAYVGDSAFDNIMIEDPDGNTADLTAVFVSTGVCHVTYTIPATLTSGVYELSAQPSIAGGAQGSAMIVVNVLDVWYHKLSATGETVTFEVCVADLNGEPVNGASVLVRRYAWSDPMTATTDATGKVLMTLTNVEGQAGVSGYVLSGGFNQSIEGVVFNPRADEPGNNLDIIWNGNDYNFNPGESVNLQYTAFMDEVPMYPQDIHYYVTAIGTDYGLSPFGGISGEGHVDAPFSVVIAGTVTTSTIGQFSIDFNAPSTQSTVNVKFEVPTPAQGNQGDENDELFYEVWGEDWERGSLFYVVQGSLVDDSLVKISGDKFNTGPLNTVKVTMTTTPFDVITAMWGIDAYDPDNPDAYDPAWFNWVPGGAVISLTETASGEYEGDYLVPAFLDGEDTIVIMAGYADSSTGYPHYNMKEIARDTGGISMLLIIGIIVILVIVVLVIYLIKR